jgi:hypothetical protein
MLPHFHITKTKIVKGEYEVLNLKGDTSCLVTIISLFFIPYSIINNNKITILSDVLMAGIVRSWKMTVLHGNDLTVKCSLKFIQDI